MMPGSVLHGFTVVCLIVVLFLVICLVLVLFTREPRIHPGS